MVASYRKEPPKPALAMSLKLPMGKPTSAPTENCAKVLELARKMSNPMSRTSFDFMVKFFLSEIKNLFIALDHSLCLHRFGYFQKARNVSTNHIVAWLAILFCSCE